MSKHDQPDEGTDRVELSDEEILQQASQLDAFPEAEDYSPMDNHFREGAVEDATDEDRWDEFGLALRPIHWNGHDTGKRLLLRNGDCIDIVSDQYQVLPHERLAVIAQRVADELGMVKWDEFGDEDDWYIKMDDHIIMDHDGRRMHGLWAQPDPVPIDGGDDEIHIGFAVHNSIDRSLGFNVGLFTFRHACANMVWMGVNGAGMAFDDREVVSHHSHKHTKGLTADPAALQQTIEETLFFADDVCEAYRNWRDEYVRVEDGLRLLDRAESGQLAISDLPEWLQDAAKAISAAEERAEDNDTVTDDHDDGLTDEAREGLIRSQLPGQASRWETYNDLTENIWHSNSTQDTSKRRKMKAVHDVFEPETSLDDVTIR